MRFVGKMSMVDCFTLADGIFLRMKLDRYCIGFNAIDQAELAAENG